MAGEALNIEVCGPVAIAAPGGASVRIDRPQPQLVLAVLALENRPITRESLADVLWGDRLSDHWSGALRGLLSKLRRVLDDAGVAPDVLRSASGMVWLEAEVTTEVTRADALLARGHASTLEDDALAELQGLASDLRRPFLAHDDSDWTETQRYRISALADRIDHVVLDALHAQGRLDETIGWAQRRITLMAADEVAHLALVEALLDAGERAAAVAAFDEYARMVAAEYGRAPDEALRARIGTQRPSSTTPALGTPVAHHPHAAEPFAGRAAPLQAITEAWHRVVTGDRVELVVINAPSGMGKTRLADRATLSLEGAQVLWGRSRPGGDRSFGPLVDALAGVFDRDAALAHAMAVAVPRLEVLLPEARDTAAGNVSAPSGNARDAAMGVAVDVMRRLATRPTVLVVDDVQWTEPDGLAVLANTLVEVDAPLLVIATTREVSGGLAEHLVQLQRALPVTRIDLDALTVDDVAELVHDAGLAPGADDEAVASVHRRTGGVPFFTSEVLRDARRTGNLLGRDAIPDSVADWLDHFVRALPTLQREVLEVVTVFGSQADLAGIEVVAGHDPLAVADALDALAEAGLVVIADDGSVRVPHDLTSGSVYRSIGTARRSAIHRLVGDHLHATGARTELQALHWSRAGSRRRTQTLTARLAAGASALEQGAWSAALEQFSAAQLTADDPARQVDALIGAGTALLHLGEHDRARRSLESATELADHHGLDHALAQATLLLVGRAGRGALVGDDARQTALLRAAHRRLLLGEPHGDERTQLLLAHIERELALSLLFSGGFDERAELLETALRRTRVVTDATPDDLAAVLLGMRLTKLDAEGFAERIDDLDEVLALPHGRLTAEVLAAAYTYRHEDLLRMGRRAGALADLDLAECHANDANLAYWQWAVQTWRGLSLAIDGNFDEALATVDAAAAQRPGVPEAVACQQVNLVSVRLLQGRAGEVVPLLQAAVEAFPQIPAYRASLAIAAAEAGEAAVVTPLLDAFVADDFTSLPLDTNRFFALGVLAHAAASVAHEPAARRLWDLLEPFAELHVVVNCYGGGGAYWGPTHWALARLAVLAGRSVEEAAAQLRAARDQARCAPALVARIDAERVH